MARGGKPPGKLKIRRCTRSVYAEALPLDRQSARHLWPVSLPRTRGQGWLHPWATIGRSREGGEGWYICTTNRAVHLGTQQASARVHKPSSASSADEREHEVCLGICQEAQLETQWHHFAERFLAQVPVATRSRGNHEAMATHAALAWTDSTGVTELSLLHECIEPMRRASIK
jgi:hypothetical protein